jgi:hypothetical protein
MSNPAKKLEEFKEMLDFVAQQTGVSEHGRFSQAITEAYEDGIASVLYIRCLEHKAIPQFNFNGQTGEECGACIQERHLGFNDFVVILHQFLTHYPEDIFDGSSGDPGPHFVVKLREALKELDKKS